MRNFFRVLPIVLLLAPFIGHCVAQVENLGTLVSELNKADREHRKEDLRTLCEKILARDVVADFLAHGSEPMDDVMQALRDLKQLNSHMEDWQDELAQQPNSERLNYLLAMASGYVIGTHESGSGATNMFLPIHLRLKREGTKFIAEVEEKAGRWNTIKSLTIAMPRTILAGYCGSAVTANFSAQNLIGRSGPLPDAPWQQKQIGHSITTGRFQGSQITGAGSPAGSPPYDDIFFAYREVEGDVVFDVMLDKFDARNNAGSAGIMLRSSLDPGAPFVSLCLKREDNTVWAFEREFQKKESQYLAALCALRPKDEAFSVACLQEMVEGSMFSAAKEASDRLLATMPLAARNHPALFQAINQWANAGAQMAADRVAPPSSANARPGGGPISQSPPSRQLLPPMRSSQVSPGPQLSGNAIAASPAQMSAAMQDLLKKGDLAGAEKLAAAYQKYQARPALNPFNQVGDAFDLLDLHEGKTAPMPILWTVPEGDTLRIRWEFAPNNWGAQPLREVRPRGVAVPALNGKYDLEIFALRGLAFGDNLPKEDMIARFPAAASMGEWTGTAPAGHNWIIGVLKDTQGAMLHPTSPCVPATLGENLLAPLNITEVQRKQGAWISTSKLLTGTALRGEFLKNPWAITRLQDREEQMVIEHKAIAIDPNAEYTFAGWLKTPNGQAELSSYSGYGADASLGVFFLDAVGKQIGEFNEQTHIGGRWTLITAVFGPRKTGGTKMIPPSATQALIRLDVRTQCQVGDIGFFRSKKVELSTP